LINANLISGQGLTELTLWRKGTLDGVFKAKAGNIEPAVLIEAAQSILGSYPDASLSLTSVQVAKLLPIMTFQDVAKEANSKDDLTHRIQEQWLKDDTRKRNEAKRITKRRNQEYAIQLDSLMAPKPTAQKKKKKDKFKSNEFIVDSDNEQSGFLSLVFWDLAFQRMHLTFFSFVLQWLNLSRKTLSKTGLLLSWISNVRQPSLLFPFHL